MAVSCTKERATARPMSASSAACSHSEAPIAIATRARAPPPPRANVDRRAHATLLPPRSRSGRPTGAPARGRASRGPARCPAARAARRRPFDRVAGARPAPRSARRVAAPAAPGPRRASMTRCCSPTREPAAVAVREGVVQAGERERAAGVGLPDREPGSEGHVFAHGALEQGRKLGHERDLAPELEDVELAERTAVEAHLAASGSARRLSSRSSVDFPDRTARRRPSPRATRPRSSPFSTGRPARAALTPRSSKSIDGLSGAGGRHGGANVCRSCP